MNNTKITASAIKSLKGKEPIYALTAYDYPTALLLGKAGIHIVHVGDSLGMVVLGYPDTTFVTMDEIVHHTRIVARSKINSLISADMPYKSYDTVEDAVRNSKKLVQAGAEAVKIEGGRSIIAKVKAIINEGIPVIGHLGMLPQNVVEEGGYRIKGRKDEERDALLEDAKHLEDAGVFAIVLELVSAPVAADITKVLKIPTIGIGSGMDCDGQILVSNDLFGTSPGFIPKHVKIRGNLTEQMFQLIEKWKQSLVKPQ